MGWPDLTYRSRLEPELRNELDQLVSLVIGWNSAEHGADGQHTTITVDGIQFRRADGSIVGTISVVDGVITVTFPPTSPPSSAGLGIQIDDVLIATHEPLRPTTMGSGIDLNTDAAPEGADLAGGRWCVAAAKDGLFSNALVFGNRAGNAAANVSNYVALYYDPNPATLGGYAFCPPAAGSPALRFTIGSRIDSRLLWDEINGKYLTAQVAILEQGRLEALGHWTDIAVAPGDFTGLGGMTVTTVSASTFRYALVGNMMTILWYFPTIVFGGTPSAGVTLTIPNGRVSQQFTFNTAAGQNNGVGIVALTQVDALGTQLIFLRPDFSTWAVGVNNALYGQITFSIA